MKPRPGPTVFHLLFKQQLHTNSPHLKTLDCCLQKPPPRLQPRTQRRLATRGGGAFPSAVFAALASLEGTRSEGSVAPVLFPMEMGLEMSILPLGSPLFF